ncbi:MAG: copper transporter [Firmicutes bacterium]|jgi:hypothetical protein|nr:copper transporter [Bacillota bacterium]
MDQQQNYIVSLIAVFLALGIGILIGAAMGENALIANQIAVIEELNNEIACYKEEVETQLTSVARLEEELASWQSLEEEYLNILLVEDQITDVIIKIIAQESLPVELVDFLKLCGCSYQIFVFTEADTRSPEELGEEGESVLLLEAGSTPLKNDLLELILREGKYLTASDVIYKTADGNFLRVRMEQNISVDVVNRVDQKRECFMAYGALDSFCLELLHKIGQEGKTVLRIDAPKRQENTAGQESSTWERFTLNNFFSRYKLLEFLRAID